MIDLSSINNIDLFAGSADFRKGILRSIIFSLYFSFEYSSNFFKIISFYFIKYFQYQIKVIIQ